MIHQCLKMVLFCLPYSSVQTIPPKIISFSAVFYKPAAKLYNSWMHHIINLQGLPSRKSPPGNQQIYPVGRLKAGQLVLKYCFKQFFCSCLCKKSASLPLAGLRTRSLVFDLSCLFYDGLLTTKPFAANISYTAILSAIIILFGNFAEYNTRTEQ